MSSPTESDESEDGFRSGFVAMYGRPNTGKSTLVNAMVGERVSITSNKPQTTRHQIRGVLTTPDAQAVFIDVPGIGKPRTALGNELNRTARSALADADVVCFVVDGRSGYGRGDAFLAESIDPDRTVVVVNKIDGLSRAKVAEQLAELARLDASAYFAVSAFTGANVPELVRHLVSRLPHGPRWYPTATFTDMSDARWVAELVREQLLRKLREELPHSVATRVSEWEGKKITVEILVERESQKGIVIGKGGEMLKQVGTQVRRQLAAGYHLDLLVVVDPNWQHDPAGVERVLDL